MTRTQPLTSGPAISLSLALIAAWLSPDSVQAQPAAGSPLISPQIAALPSALEPIPDPPDVTLSDEFLVAPVSREMEEIDEQSPVDLDVRGLTRALDDLSEAKVATRAGFALIWFIGTALFLSAGTLTTALITPAPLEPFIFAAGTLFWGLDLSFRTGVEEEVRDQWRELSVAERHVEYPRYVRHLKAMAEAEERHIRLTGLVGYLMAALGTIAVVSTIATGGPLGIVAVGAGVLGFGLSIGMMSFTTGPATRIYEAFDQGLYTDYEFSISDLDDE